MGVSDPVSVGYTIYANTNPNPNCRPGHRPWPLTPWQSLPGRRPWPLTPWQSLPGHRPWPLTPWQSLPGRRPWPLTRAIISSNGNPTGAVYSNRSNLDLPNDPRDLHMTDTLNSKKNRYANLLSLMACILRPGFDQPRKFYPRNNNYLFYTTIQYSTSAIHEKIYHENFFNHSTSKFSTFENFRLYTVIIGIVTSYIVY